MKISIKTIATAIALSALVAGPASAMVSQGDLNKNIHSALNADSNIFATVNDGVVTLSGYFSDAGDKNAAIRAAMNSVGVDKVINVATQTN